MYNLNILKSELRLGANNTIKIPEIYAIWKEPKRAPWTCTLTNYFSMERR